MTHTTLSTDLLRQLALMQHKGEDYFILNGKAFAGTIEEAQQGIEGFKDDEEKPDLLVWCEDNLTEVEELDPEDYDNDYLVLTDEEADEKAKEYITDSLWAFNPSFLADMTGFDEEIFQAIVDNGKCESNNDVLYNTIQKTCGIDDFVTAAIQADGRGHFMSSYDGEENEETVQGETFYIYRIN